MKKSEIVGNIIIVCFFSGMLVYSSGLHQVRRFGEVGGGFWPILTLALATLFSIILLIKNVLAYRKERHASSPGADIPPDVPISGEEREGRKRIALSVVILLIYIIAMPYLGFLLSTCLFTLAFIYALGERRKLILIITPLLLTAVIVVVFGTFIGIRFPRGQGFLAAISRFIY